MSMTIEELRLAMYVAVLEVVAALPLAETPEGVGTAVGSSGQAQARSFWSFQSLGQYHC
jgi:hypothetical protein